MTKTKDEMEEDAPPALFGHCVRIYSAMLAEATSVQINEDGEDEDGEDLHIIVYEGFTTALITQQLNLSSPYYTKALRALKAMGCIRQLRRGGSSTPSQWELIYEPTYEAYARQEPEKAEPHSKRSDDIAELRQQIQTLTGRLSKVEKWQGDVNRTLVRKLGKEPA